MKLKAVRKLKMCRLNNSQSINKNLNSRKRASKRKQEREKLRRPKPSKRWYSNTKLEVKGTCLLFRRHLVNTKSSLSRSLI